MNYTIKQLATLANISVRTLHYYDELGLLKPYAVSDNGYRHYTDSQLHKLQQILFFRELDFSLGQIKDILESDTYDELRALEDQKKLLLMKKKRLENVIQTVDETMIRVKGGEGMKNDTLFKSFNDADIAQFKDEVAARWGNTDAYRQSIERTKHWTKEDYKKKVAESKAFIQLLADAMQYDIKSEHVQLLMARQYEQINAYYDCSYEMFRNLAKMYIVDPRFTKTYDDVKPGLAQFVHDAMLYYASEHERV